MKFLTVTLLLFLSYNLYSQQGWFWINPLPQGNFLYGVHSSSDLTVVVGAHGTILTADENGGHLRNAGTTEALFSVSISGNQIWASGTEGTIIHSSDGSGISWETQTTTVDKQLRSIFFINENIGWSVGELETILKTTDGGNTWQTIYANGSLHYFEVFFLDENNGWLAGAGNTTGIIKKSTDGGITWQNSLIPTTRMNSIHFGSPDFGCAVGDEGRIFRTTNGGTNWELANSNTSEKLKDVFLDASGNGWAVGYNGTIISTSDWGDNWNSEPSPTYSHLNAIFGEWAVGEAGRILHTTDGGNIWELECSGFTDNISDLDFVTNTIGYASGPGGTVYRTMDGGDTWEELNVGSSLDLFAIDFKKWQDITGSGYVVGEADGQNFTVYRTTDYGSTWIDVSFQIPNVSFATHLYDCYRMLGKTYVTGRFGLIARTTDAGSSWEVQKINAQSYDLWTIDFEGENIGWAAGSSGTVLKTTNGGEQWFEVNPDNTSNFRSIYFSDTQHGWVAGVGGVIYRTTDGGYNWIKTTPNVTFELINSIYFVDNNTGWLAGTSGTVLHTTNGGVDWYFQESGTNNLLNSITFTETGTGWIGGWYGTVLHTEDGGGYLTYQSFWRNFLNLSLADPGETSDEMDVVVNGKFKDGYSLSGVSVILDTLYHSNVNDLVILLTHQGVTDTLVMQPESIGSNFINCTLSDASAELIDLAEPPFTGIYKPHSPLSAFNGIDPNGIWTLKIIDMVSGNSGTLNAWGLRLYFDAATDIRSDYSMKPDNYKVFQNFPNPFNPVTTIRWNLPKPGLVTLKIYDILGREITTLVNKELNAGKHETIFDATLYSSGVYFYQIKAGEFIFTRKMLLLK